jgi:hypothetical protein
MPSAKKKTWSGRLTLRIAPDLHKRIDDTARALGLDLNGLLNLVIRWQIGYFEDVAYKLTSPKAKALTERWRDLCPTMPFRMYTLSLDAFLDGRHFIAENGREYRINDAGDDFIEVKPEDPPHGRSAK